MDDEHSIHKVSFNGIDIPVPKEQETSFSFSQALLLGREEDSIAFLTEDVAGNRNEGIIQLEFQRASERVIQPYASMQGLTRLAYLSGRNDSALDAALFCRPRTTRPFGDAVNEDGSASILLCEERNPLALSRRTGTDREILWSHRADDSIQPPKKPRRPILTQSIWRGMFRDPIPLQDLP